VESSDDDGTREDRASKLGVVVDVDVVVVDVVVVVVAVMM
jgi:hypothetical protein